MPPKRKRRVQSVTSPWSWVATEVNKETDIKHEHLLAAAGLNLAPSCQNKYALRDTQPAQGELDADVIVISDDEDDCSKKNCKSNPGCLNHLGQASWENFDTAKKLFFKAAKLGDDPLLDSREPELPIGLRNLGATCYANASLQVWFRDIAFRRGVYLCKPQEDEEQKFKDSPIFQLQVTFAALQESTQSVFNPAKLVESLQLRAAEQQDAQEFSKLFMSHLDAEFKKQSLHGLQSLVADQFQGKQVYGTLCENCHSKSERVTDYLELEINFQKNSKLENCISDLLKPEVLTGDNKYSCSHCGSLQNATRYTQLQSLPPVLHFSLLRFVFDLKTLERKKSKHTIEFPLTLNMGRFLGDHNRSAVAAHAVGEGNVTKADKASGNCDENVYELRGVLLHKGASAYHGHYEAQVFDLATGTWFQFNDETVTKIKKLGDKQKKVVIDVDADEEPATGTKKQRGHARKRQRVDDSDVEEVEAEVPTTVTSRDAYMLVYARKRTSISDTQRVNDSSTLIPTPPRHAMEVVEQLNAEHDEACEKFAAKKKLVLDALTDVRKKVQTIYEEWDSSEDDEECIVVSQQALEAWLSKHCMQTALSQLVSTLKGDTNPSPLDNIQIPNDDIVCVHKKLDYRKAGNMKRISRSAYHQIIHHTHCAIEPELSLLDVCEQCVKDAFREKLYQIEHPRLVKQYDDIIDVESDHGYWISKAWLKDWRLQKPKMHVSGQDDPPPNGPDYDGDVRCEHRGLSHAATSRKRVSARAAEFLQTLFPMWDPLSGDSEQCVVCEVALATSKEDTKELRLQAENEKGKLTRLFSYANETNTFFIEDSPMALIPFSFMRDWRLWITKPKDTPRPETIDNSWWFCEHGSLTYDPNCPGDLDGMVLILRTEWDVLEGFYTAGPLIAIAKNTDGRYDHEIPVCKTCYQTRKTEWDSTDITVRLCGRGPCAGQSTYVSRNGAGSRQSKRLRQVQQHGEKRKIRIKKSTTVVEIKTELQKLFSIHIICQRLFHRDVELLDNAATAESLQILANDLLDLREESEDDLDGAPKKKARESGFSGFGGTLLSGNLAQLELRSEPTTERETTKPCPACTFSNTLDAVSCTICDTFFA